MSVVLGGVRLGAFGMGFDARGSYQGPELRGYLHGCMSGGMAVVLWHVLRPRDGVQALNLGGVVMGFDGGVGTSGADTQRGNSGSVSWICWVRSAG